MFSIINIIGRMLKHVHYSILCSTQFALNVALSFVVVLAVNGGPSIPKSLEDLLFILLLGTCRSFSTMLFVRACQVAKSQRIASLNYTQAIFGYTIDVLVYNYTLQLAEIIAMLIVLITGVITFIQTHKEHIQNSELKEPLLGRTR